MEALLLVRTCFDREMTEWERIGEKGTSIFFFHLPFSSLNCDELNHSKHSNLGGLNYELFDSNDTEFGSPYINQVTMI